MITCEERISRFGMLWIFSSVAADCGRPSNYHYGAAKAALNTYCEGLLARCVNKPFKIRIIKAGYMDTKMSGGKTPKILTLSTSYETLLKILIKVVFGYLGLY